MPLPNIDYSPGQDTMQDAFDKTNAGLDESGKALVSSNDTTHGYLNGKLVAGDNVTLTEGSDGGNETLTIDTKDKTNSNNSWTGSQALTSSYATVGTLSYTTPNDGVTRVGILIAEVVFDISSGAGDNSMDTKIRNNSDSLDLRTVSVAMPDIQSGSTGRIQAVAIYVGSIGPNKTIIVQAKRPTSNGVSATSGTLTFVELYR